MKKKDPAKTKKMEINYDDDFYKRIPPEVLDRWRADQEEKIKKFENGEYVVGENFLIHREPSHCLICDHIEEDIYGRLSCEAFPDEIPLEVYRGTHNKKHPLQKGEIIFELDGEHKKVFESIYGAEGNTTLRFIEQIEKEKKEKEENKE